MEVVIQRWGNSMGLRIPAKLLKQLHLQEGSAVELRVKGSKFEVVPKKHNLTKMLSRINEDNLHHEVFKNDAPKGGEEW